MKNLVKESLKVQFFKDKDTIIYDYLTATGKTNNIQSFTYEQGKKVLVDVNQGIAYSRNGYFFSVILNDDNYIESLCEEDMLDFLDGEYAKKYENQEPEIEDEE